MRSKKNESGIFNFDELENVIKLILPEEVYTR